MPTSTNSKQPVAGITSKPSTKRSSECCSGCGAFKKKRDEDILGDIIISPAVMKVFDDFSTTYRDYQYEHSTKSEG